ncbi:hypothetical protein CYMTET_36610 [Cymbomonas tetramitiformis]|uniref:Uncharacterized protein n=1 Tax=Cymbomonas tetramitiformis TaxID=36881 RepID=A0AAE0F724_9CHLO|nr:hypothetical protein CYMTET_36610 [Cymbomonas tetramitiformis]
MLETGLSCYVLLKQGCGNQCWGVKRRKACLVPPVLGGEEAEGPKGRGEETEGTVAPKVKEETEGVPWPCKAGAAGRKTYRIPAGGRDGKACLHLKAGVKRRKVCLCPQRPWGKRDEGVPGGPGYRVKGRKRYRVAPKAGVKRRKACARWPQRPGVKTKACLRPQRSWGEDEETEGVFGGPKGAIGERSADELVRLQLLGEHAPCTRRVATKPSATAETAGSKAALILMTTLFWWMQRKLTTSAQGSAEAKAEAGLPHIRGIRALEMGTEAFAASHGLRVVEPYGNREHQNVRVRLQHDAPTQ